VSWVKWDKICSPLDRGGLRIKNLEMFYKTLLEKWFWGLLSEKEDLWRELVMSRYGVLSMYILVDGGYPIRGSQWWCDMLNSC